MKTTLTLSNWKNFKKLTFPIINNFNIINGENNVGKSNLILVLRLLKKLCDYDVKTTLNNLYEDKDCLALEGSKPIIITLSSIIKDENVKYILELNLDKSNNLIISSQKISIGDKKPQIILDYKENNYFFGKEFKLNYSKIDKRLSFIINEFQNFILSLSYYSFDITQLKCYDCLDDYTIQGLDFDGCNLYACLNEQFQNNEIFKDKFTKYVSQFIGNSFIETYIKINKSKFYCMLAIKTKLKSKVIINEGKYLSNSTLRFICIIYVILLAKKDDIIIFDNITEELSPSNINLLMDIIVKEIKEKKFNLILTNTTDVIKNYNYKSINNLISLYSLEKDEVGDSNLIPIN